MTDTPKERNYAPGSLAYVLFQNGQRHLAYLSHGFIWCSLDDEYALAAEGGFDAWPCVAMSIDAWRLQKSAAWEAGFDARSDERLPNANPYWDYATPGTEKTCCNEPVDEFCQPCPRRLRDASGDAS